MDAELFNETYSLIMEICDAAGYSGDKKVIKLFLDRLWSENHINEHTLTRAEQRFKDWPVRTPVQMKKSTVWTADGKAILCVSYETNGNDCISIKRTKDDIPRYIIDTSEFMYHIDEEMMDIFKALINEIKEANGDGRD